MVVLPNSDARLRARFYCQLYSTGPDDGDSRQTEESKKLCQWEPKMMKQKLTCFSSMMLAKTQRKFDIRDMTYLDEPSQPSLPAFPAQALYPSQHRLA